MILLKILIFCSNDETICPIHVVYDFDKLSQVEWHEKLNRLKDIFNILPSLLHVD
jgi:hypothetical protein